MMLSLAVLTGLSLLAYRLRLSRPYLIVGWLWFLGVMFPVSGMFLLLDGTAFHNDRYTYLPHIGLLIMLVWGAADLLAAARVPACATTGLVAAVLAVLLVLTMRQVAFWKDSETLFTHNLAVTGNHPLVLKPLVGYCLDTANSASLPDDERPAYFEKVIEYANRGLRYDATLNIPLAVAYASPHAGPGIRNPDKAQTAFVARARQSRCEHDFFHGRRLVHGWRLWQGGLLF